MTLQLVIVSAALQLGPLHQVDGEKAFLSNITQITHREMGFINAGEAYFSPDARSIIFQATPEGATDYQIYSLELSSRKLRMVSTGKGACTCAFFHPSGKKIIFASSHLDPDLDKVKVKEDDGGYSWDFNQHMDIFEANPDGSNLRRLTTTMGYDAEGSYSPDGKKIVFTSQRDDDLEIYVMNADGTGAQRITNSKGYDGGPFFSPDGKSIIYRGDHRSDDKMNLQLRIVNADGSADRALTDNPIFNWCPFWHPSGKAVIFTQTDHEAWSKGSKPNYDLFLITPAGTELTRVTFAAEFDGLPVFSPNGTKLMWTSQRGGLEEPQIFLADFKLPGKFH
jgi:Tol biopolymer transport system component